MTPLQRAALVIAAASASAALVGVISLALHAPRVFPGMVVSFVLTLACATWASGGSRG